MINLEDILENQYIENEIQKILDNITPTEYKSFNEIEQKKLMIIDNIYSRFMYYDINKSNKEEVIKQLKGYECINIDELKKGNYIKYLNLKIFYNLKLSTGGIVLEILDNKNVFVRNGNRFNNINSNFFFRKFSEDALVKMKLLDIINDNDK